MYLRGASWAAENWSWPENGEVFSLLQEAGRNTEPQWRNKQGNLVLSDGALLSGAISVILSLSVPSAPSRQRAEASWKRGAVCCISPIHVSAQVSHTDTQTLGASLLRKCWQARGHATLAQVSLLMGYTCFCD